MKKKPIREISIIRNIAMLCALFTCLIHISICFADTGKVKNNKKTALTIAYDFLSEEFDIDEQCIKKGIKDAKKGTGWDVEICAIYGDVRRWIADKSLSGNCWNVYIDDKIIAGDIIYFQFNLFVDCYSKSVIAHEVRYGPILYRNTVPGDSILTFDEARRVACVFLEEKGFDELSDHLKHEKSAKFTTCPCSNYCNHKVWIFSCSGLYIAVDNEKGDIHYTTVYDPEEKTLFCPHIPEGYPIFLQMRMNEESLVIISGYDYRDMLIVPFSDMLLRNGFVLDKDIFSNGKIDFYILDYGRVINALLPDGSVDKAFILTDDSYFLYDGETVWLDAKSAADIMSKYFDIHLEFAPIQVIDELDD